MQVAVALLNICEVDLHVDAPVSQKSHEMMQALRKLDSSYKPTSSLLDRVIVTDVLSSPKEPRTLLKYVTNLVPEDRVNCHEALKLE